MPNYLGGDWAAQICTSLRSSHLYLGPSALGSHIRYPANIGTSCHVTKTTSELHVMIRKDREQDSAGLIDIMSQVIRQPGLRSLVRT